MTTIKAPIPHTASKTKGGGGGNGSTFKPTCPGVYMTTVLKADYVERDYDETVYTPAQCQWLKFKVECHLSTAFVTASSRWVVPNNTKGGGGGGGASKCAFALPVDPGGTVTSISATMKKKRIASCVVPVSDTSGFRGKRFGRDDVEPVPTHPEVFALAIPGGLPAGETIDVDVTYFQPMTFVDGSYVFQAPTTLPAPLHTNLPLSSVLSFVATVRSAYPGDVHVECPSHPIAVTQRGSGVTRVELDPTRAPSWSNVNVVLRIPVWSEHIAAAAVQQPARQGPTQDTRGSFAIAMAPPRPENCAPFPRSVVFMVDRSGSMAGGPMASANEALVTGLKSLTPEDKFNVVAFDNLQEYLSKDGMVQATPEAVEEAVAWVGKRCTARGTTDIMTPLQSSLAMLAKSGAAGSVPFLFLITDGAVDNEREICKVLQQAQATAKPTGGMATLPRVCTFGIGRFCNHYFLKMLANIGGVAPSAELELV